MPFFQLGKTVMTARTHEVLPKDIVQKAFHRHSIGDWGDLDDMRGEPVALR